MSDHDQAFIDARYLLRKTQRVYPPDSTIDKAIEAAILALEVAWELCDERLASESLEQSR